MKLSVRSQFILQFQLICPKTSGQEIWGFKNNQ